MAERSVLLACWPEGGARTVFARLTAPCITGLCVCWSEARLLTEGGQWVVGGLTVPGSSWTRTAVLRAAVAGVPTRKVGMCGFKMKLCWKGTAMGRGCSSSGGGSGSGSSSSWARGRPSRACFSGLGVGGTAHSTKGIVALLVFLVFLLRW